MEVLSLARVINPAFSIAAGAINRQATIALAIDSPAQQSINRFKRDQVIILALPSWPLLKNGRSTKHQAAWHQAVRTLLDDGTTALVRRSIRNTKP